MASTTIVATLYVYLCICDLVVDDLQILYCGSETRLQAGLLLVEMVAYVN